MLMLSTSRDRELVIVETSQRCERPRVVARRRRRLVPGAQLRPPGGPHFNMASTRLSRVSSMATFLFNDHIWTGRDGPSTLTPHQSAIWRARCAVSSKESLRRVMRRPRRKTPKGERRSWAFVSGRRWRRSRRTMGSGSSTRASSSLLIRSRRSFSSAILHERCTFRNQVDLLSRKAQPSATLLKLND